MTDPPASAALSVENWMGLAAARRQQPTTSSQTAWPFSGRSRQLRRNVGEYRGQIGADQAGCPDNHDRDESGNQAIFNGGDARFVASEMDKQICIEFSYFRIK